jgi:hypothetical protein
MDARFEHTMLDALGGVSHEDAVDWAEAQYTAFAERRRLEAEAKGAERYLDGLAAGAKLLEGERHQAGPKPRTPRTRKKGST